MTGNSPLVKRIAIVVGAVVLTAIVSMATTLGVSRSIEGNATAINIAGSLRMGAYELLARSGAEDVRSASFLAQLNAYESRISHPEFTRSIPDTDDHPLSQQYQAMQTMWQETLRPALIARADSSSDQISDNLLGLTRQYVAQANQLVGMLEARTEARIDLLHLIQIISLVFSIVIISGLFWT